MKTIRLMTRSRSRLLFIGCPDVDITNITAKRGPRGCFFVDGLTEMIIFFALLAIAVSQIELGST